MHGYCFFGGGQIMNLKTFSAAAVLATLVMAGAAVSTPALAGGCSVTVYWDANFAGESWHTRRDVPWVGQHWNDQISAIRIESGVWDFYFDKDYGGESERLRPGDYAFVGPHWNDQISSYRCVHPTRD
jgi:hypothetical protein